MAPTPTNGSAERGAGAGWALAAGLGLFAAGLALRLGEALREAATDPLTGLPNRRGLARAFARRLPGTALLFLDLDGFKAVNDRLGHAAGDRLLAAVAARLASALGPEDVIGRWGGDEFLLLTVEPLAVETALAAAMAGPFDLGRSPAVEPIRIGFALGAARPAPGTPLADAVAEAAGKISSRSD